MPLNLPQLREAVESAASVAELERLAAECTGRRGARVEEIVRRIRRRIAAYRAHETRRGIKPAPAPAPQAALKAAKPAPGPLSLCAFLVRAGGVRNQGGELLAILGTARARPGLICCAGMTLDRAAMAALSAGYFPEHEVASTPQHADPTAQDCGREVETMTPAALLDAIDAEIRSGRKRYPGGYLPEQAPDADREAHDRAQAEEWAAQSWRELVDIAERAGWADAWGFIVKRAGIETNIPF